jgi:hypothetical protein
MTSTSDQLDMRTWVTMRGITPGHRIPPNSTFGWGFRAIFKPSQRFPLDILPDRQGNYFPGIDNHSPQASTWPPAFVIFRNICSHLVGQVQRWAHYFSPDSNEMFVRYFGEYTIGDGTYNVICVGSPQSSAGYFYVSFTAIPVTELLPPEIEPARLVAERQGRAKREVEYHALVKELRHWTVTAKLDPSTRRERKDLLLRREALANYPDDLEQLVIGDAITVTENRDSKWFVICIRGPLALCEKLTVYGKRALVVVGRTKPYHLVSQHGVVPPAWRAELNRTERRYA